jgi:hypothetical protein
MACSISNITLTGVGSEQSGGGYQSVAVTASVIDCDEVIVQIFEPGQTMVYAGTDVVPVNGVINAQLTARNGGIFKCDQTWTVRVSCKHDPQCFDEETLHLACGCCIPYTITPAVGACQPDGSRLVSFAVTFTITDAKCLPYVVQLDFGDNTYGAAHVYTALGTYSWPDQHSYSCLVSHTYTVAVVDSTHPAPDCPQSTIQLVLDACALDCCADILAASADVGACADDCTRAVVLKTEFNPCTPPCGQATLQWTITDKNGVAVVWNSVAFATASPSPNLQTPVQLGASGSPYTATLNSINPPDSACPSRTVTIFVKPCNTPPKCPDGLSLSAVDLGCEKDAGGNCSRKYVFYADATTYSGCGTGAQPTQFTLDFGDGSSVNFGVASSGAQGLTFHHFYSGGGTKTAVLSVAGCTETATCTLSDITQCSPADCGGTGSGGGGGGGTPAIKCVICTSCQDYLAKIDASFIRTALCKLLMALFVLSFAACFAEIATCAHIINPADAQSAANSAASAATPDGLLLFSAGVGFVALYLLLRSLCGSCCLYCATLWGIIFAAVAIVVLLVIGNLCLPGTLIALVFLAVLFYSNEVNTKLWCQQELAG